MPLKNARALILKNAVARFTMTTSPIRTASVREHIFTADAGPLEHDQFGTQLVPRSGVLKSKMTGATISTCDFN